VVRLSLRLLEVALMHVKSINDRCLLLSSLAHRLVPLVEFLEQPNLLLFLPQVEEHAFGSVEMRRHEG
jgi:hypothetical protein